MRMRIVSAPECRGWLDDGRILEKDDRGPKVVLLAGGQILKIFYARRWHHRLLYRLRPPARQFVRNHGCLQQLGIRVPDILESCWLAPGLSACRYQLLPGQSLERLFHETPGQLEALLPRLAALIARLHAGGIYFRSLHLGNILHLPDGQFGLIDFLDLQQKHRPLQPDEVRRNFRHLENHLQRNHLDGFPLAALLEHYRQRVASA